MSDAPKPRMPIVAVSLAALAVVVAGVAAVRVLTRDDGSAAQHTSGSVRASIVLELRVLATDVVKLRDKIEAVVEAGTPRGLHVADPALASALGLDVSDLLVALSGHAVTGAGDINSVLRSASTLRATTMYAEIERGGAHLLLRWSIDGDLHDARHDQLAALVPPPSALPGSAQALQQLLDKIEPLDATHVRVPRSTFEALLDVLPALARGARVVPSMRNGQNDGYKVYSVRPDSAYARIGIVSDDVVQAINGDPLSEVDDPLEMFVNLRHADEVRIDLDRQGQRVGIIIEITK